MDTKRLAKFLIITFVITGIAWSGLAVLTSLNIIPFSHPLGTILHIIGGFGPTIATFFVLEEKNTVKSILHFIFGYRKKSLIFLFLFFYESARARFDRIDSFSNFMYVYSRRKRRGSL